MAGDATIKLQGKDADMRDEVRDNPWGGAKACSGGGERGGLQDEYVTGDWTWDRGIVCTTEAGVGAGVYARHHA